MNSTLQCFRRPFIAVLAILICVGASTHAANNPPSDVPTGTLRGTVVLKTTGDPLHMATVLIVQLSRSTETNDEGLFEFTQVPVGAYDVVVRAQALADERRSVQVTANTTTTVEFQLRLATLREQITVTASGTEIPAFESFQSTTTLEPVDLMQKASASIGEVLEGESGVAKRSFGTGNARPVLRGFDGDRVLILQDGMSTGTLSSQSADHGETLNVLDLERLEVVRGPATLLYGSNAVGGVVNAITGQHQIHEHPHKGISGYLSGTAGSANNMASGGGGFEYGWKRWALRGGGGGGRSGDYSTPQGEIPNSRSRNGDVRIGTGYYGNRGFFSLSYDYDNRRFGIPFAVFLESGGTDGGTIAPENEIINLRLRRHDLKFTGGLRNLNSWVSDIRTMLGYTHYRHGEFDGDVLGSDFFNKQFNYRISFEQRKRGRLSGSFGFSGQSRDYDVVGAEALAPPVRQTTFAVFALETFDFSRLSLQFGGRFERVGYDPGINLLLPPAPGRTFDGISAAAGVRVPLWDGGVFVANYTHSFRAPALEELYNNGEHPGNLAFEIGNPQLADESGNGIDLSVRHKSARFHAEGNFYYYRIRDFVFLTPTGNISPGGFFEAEYLAGDTRYRGGEAKIDAMIREWLWIEAGLDAVNARLSSPIVSTVTGLLTPEGSPLPRIPPLRGRVGLDIRLRGFSLHPEAVMVHSQDDFFSTETRTAGYTTLGFGASYTIPRAHSVQIFSVNAFNLGDRLHRNHLSFIKNLAPELGRGVRVSYTVRFL